MPRQSTYKPNSRKNVVRWYELPPEITRLLDEWAKDEQRTPKAQVQYIIINAISQRQAEQKPA